MSRHDMPFLAGDPSSRAQDTPTAQDGVRRVLTAPAAGPIALDLSMPTGSIEVLVDPSITTAQVTVEIVGGDGSADERIAGITSSVSARSDELAWSVTVPGSPAGGVVDAGVLFGNSRVTGHVTISGAVVINGRLVTQESFGDGASVGRLRASVRLPALSTLSVDSMSADLSVTGPGALAYLAFDSTSGDLHCTAPAASVRARSTSGDLSLRDVGNVSANTTSGNVRVEGCDASLGLTSTSGDISIDRYIGADLSADCTSGDVTVNYGPDAYPHGSCRIRTVSGDIRTSGALPSAARISTVSGRHRRR